MLVAAAGALSTILAAGCGSDDTGSTPSCVEDLDLACQPLVSPPTFQAVYDTTLQPTCASGRGTCHSADGAMGGLVFEDPDTAYDLLVGSTGGRARVLPGDPACSLVIERLESDDRAFRMPPGNDPLPAPEICTIVQWISEGANR
jgi:hypothetical protein